MPLTSYAVRFTDIMMHAVASASDDFARPSIYMQLDGAQATDDEDGDAGSAGPEVRLVPADANTSAPPLLSACICLRQFHCNCEALCL